MPKVLVSYVHYIEAFNIRLGKVLGWSVIVLIGILSIEAVSRYILHSPTEWSLELATFVFGTYFILGGAYVLLRGAHVNLDLLYNRWSPKTRAIADLATFSLLAVYVCIFVWGGIENVSYSLALGQHSSSAWGPPLAPMKIITVVGAGLLFLQGVALFIRDLSIVKGKPIP
jgi:TRAP-type mannitol/chloroaromatic compound transport system permease small subunit